MMKYPASAIKPSKLDIQNSMYDIQIKIIGPNHFTQP